MTFRAISQNTITKIQNELGIWISHPLEITNLFVQDYHQHFSLDRSIDSNILNSFLNHIQPCISQADAQNLIAPFTSFEIDLSIRQIGGLKSTRT